MATYSVTGTYCYETSDGYEGTGQYPGRVVDAATGTDAAETYRAAMVADWGPRTDPDRQTLTGTNVCAVALTGPVDLYIDPITAMVPVR